MVICGSDRMLSVDCCCRMFVFASYRHTSDYIFLYTFSASISTDSAKCVTGKFGGLLKVQTLTYKIL